MGPQALAVEGHVYFPVFRSLPWPLQYLKLSLTITDISERERERLNPFILNGGTSPQREGWRDKRGSWKWNFSGFFFRNPNFFSWSSCCSFTVSICIYLIFFFNILFVCSIGFVLLATLPIFASVCFCVWHHPLCVCVPTKMAFNFLYLLMFSSFSLHKPFCHTIECLHAWVIRIIDWQWCNKYVASFQPFCSECAHLHSKLTHHCHINCPLHPTILVSNLLSWFFTLVLARLASIQTHTYMCERDNIHILYEYCTYHIFH